MVPSTWEVFLIPNETDLLKKEVINAVIWIRKSTF